MTNQADKAGLVDRDDLRRRFITYVLPDEPDTLYVLLAAARDRMPPEAQQGPAFECAADLCRAILDVLPSIHAIVLGGHASSRALGDDGDDPVRGTLFRYWFSVRASSRKPAPSLRL